MTVASADPATTPASLRLWPGVVLVTVQWLFRSIAPLFSPDLNFLGTMVGAACGLGIILWWAFFSRAQRSERWGAIGLMVIALAATYFINHESMGPLWLVAYAIPVLSLAFVGWAVATRRLAQKTRRTAMIATILVACGAWTLVRTGGITGAMDSDFAWRWAPTPEERLLAAAGDEPTGAVLGGTPPPETATASTPQAEAAKMGAAWPGFRGSRRDGIVHGVEIETDWSASPPVELWRRAVGPGWSSFAVQGDLIYTQEQRGDDEIVACYRLATGEPVWRHSDTARFFESNGGAGPRGTPTLSDGRVYTFGATGVLNALDAADGSLVWSRDVAADAGAKVPVWGFSSSPLVVEDTVLVAAAGQLVAYVLASGAPRWFGPDGKGSYSSPHRLTLGGVDQVVMLNGVGATGYLAAEGTQLWQHAWGGSRIVQPALTSNGDLLIPTEITGTRRIAVANGPRGWTTKEIWRTNRLKPSFSDFVIHQGHAYGFDGRILASIDLEDGDRKWKGGRYGNGQLVLLPEQDLLLVISEGGELALVEASPDKFTELARSPALEGKTWNHPVLIDDLLLVRNGEEMAAFRLALAEG